MSSLIPERFVFDNFFFDDLIVNKREELFTWAEKLSHITSKARFNKKKQNIMSKKSRDNFIKKHNLSEEYVRIFINLPEPLIPPFEANSDEISRTLLYAIHLTYYYPNKVIIFTTSEKEKEYLKNPHFIGTTNVRFIKGDDALTLIDFYLKKCREEKTSSCD